MIQHQYMKVPVTTEGLGRKKRNLSTLNPSYASIDDRSIEEIFDYVRQFSKELRFVDQNGVESGSWESFFENQPARDGNCSPHLALLMAFLELFHQSQSSLNQVTKRHLDYYYQQILRLEKKEPKPDIVHVILELARQIDSYHLNEGTIFLAGKNDVGEDRLYRLLSNTHLTKSAVTSVRSLFVDQQFNEDEALGESKEIISGIHASEVWNSEGEAPAWKALGHSDLPVASVGFAITAPILCLPEGNRTIKISILIKYPGDREKLDLTELNTRFADNFTIALSTNKGWVFRKPDFLWMEKSIGEQELLLNIQVNLDKSVQGIDALGEEINDSIPKRWPVLKVLLDPQGPYEYVFFRDCKFVTLDLDVYVKDVRNVVLQNDESALKPNSPFHPFTGNPGINSDFYIGSKEVFSKNLTSLNIKLNWHNVPNAQLAEHYDAYGQEVSRSNTDFKVDIEILKNKDWNLVNGASLFATEDARFSKELDITIPEFELDDVFQSTLLPNQAGDKNSAKDDEGDDSSEIEKSEIEKIVGGNIEIGEAEGLMDFDSYDVHTQRGFIRLRLREPDFGHGSYSNLYTRAVTESSIKQEVADLPNQPYSPELKAVSLSYSARKEIDILDSSEYFFQIQPFGYKPIDGKTEDPWLLPRFFGEGHLHIGIKDVQPLSEVSLLIQCLEGTAAPDSKVPEIDWSYLHENEWRQFPSAGVLYDSTENLNKPGIVTFSIPEEISLDNTIFPEEHFWIQASTSRFSEGTCEITAITSQAAVLEAVVSTSPTDFDAPLPTDTIRKLKEPISEVKNIRQPYPSIPGRADETDSDFHQRIAERLRHKDRAVSLWDYERLVIEQFPNVYKVKCFRHTDSEKGFAQGKVLMIIIPDIRQYLGTDPLEPTASIQLKDEVLQFLNKHKAPWVSIEVENPVFEAIELDFMVKFRPGYHNGLHEQELQNELRKYLAPWAFDEGHEIGIGGNIYKSSILNFIEELPYVDFVTFFKMNQYDQEGNARMNVEEAFALTPISVLTTVAAHDITVIDNDEDVCEDGIGHMIVEESFTTIK